MNDASRVNQDDTPGWIRICEEGDVPPGTMLRADVEGLPPVAVFNVDGQIYVTSNICTHNVAILTDGFFEGDVVECPLHGGAFNVRTGEATQFPCETPLETYLVAIEQGAVFVRPRADRPIDPPAAMRDE